MDIITLSLLAAFLLGAVAGVTLFLFGLAYYETNLNDESNLNDEPNLNLKLNLNYNPALNKELNG
jgi:hypothetical protein